MLFCFTVHFLAYRFSLLKQTLVSTRGVQAPRVLAFTNLQGRAVCVSQLDSCANRLSYFSFKGKKAP